MSRTPGGNVGIGTTAPPSKLYVKGASGVRILGDQSTLTGKESVDFMAYSSQFSSDLGGMRIQRQSGGGVEGNIDTIFLAARNGQAASEAMRITTNGTQSPSVGIGTIFTVDPRLIVGA